MCIDWQQILFESNSKLLERFDQLAKKRFRDENLADEAFIWSLDKLKINDWSRLHHFKGKSKPSTFLYTVFFNLLEDFSRMKFGYPRPKHWLIVLGDNWVQVWKRLCLERQPAEHIIMCLGEGDKIREDEIKHMINTIKAKEPHCGQYDFVTSIDGTVEKCSSFKNIDINVQQPVQHSIEKSNELDHLEETLNIIGQLTGVTCLHPITPKFKEKIDQLSIKLKMDAEEQLILKMKFQEGMKNAAIARALDCSSYRIKKRLNNILKRLKTLFCEAGIEFS